MPFRGFANTVLKQQTPYEYPFDRMMVKVFAQFAAHYLVHKMPLTTGMMIKKWEWSRSEAGCFPRLRHFGIVNRVKNQVTGKDTNRYRLTECGEQFYLGNETVPDMIITLGGKLLPEGHDAWTHHFGKLPEWKYLRDLDFDVKGHEEWAAERKLALESTLPLIYDNI